MKCFTCKIKEGNYYNEDEPKKLFCGEHKNSDMKDKRHCEHNKRRSKCKECGGASICEHNRERSKCKECGGASICEHNKRRSECKECGGASICEHNKRRSTCKECGGASICEHNKIRNQCIICKPSCACQNCKSVYVAKKYRFSPFCFNCFCVLNPEAEIPRRYKIKEIHLREALVKNFPNTKMTFDKRVEDGCSKRRPDVLIDNGFPIVIECDENRHNNYSCENMRLMSIFQDLGNRPLRVIRFNPDGYIDDKGKRHSSCFKPTTKTLSLDKKEWEDRISKLNIILKNMLKEIPTKELEVIHLFY